MATTYPDAERLRAALAKRIIVDDIAGDHNHIDLSPDSFLSLLRRESAELARLEKLRLLGVSPFGRLVGLELRKEFWGLPEDSQPIPRPGCQRPATTPQY